MGKLHFVLQFSNTGFDPVEQDPSFAIKIPSPDQIAVVSARQPRQYCDPMFGVL